MKSILCAMKDLFRNYFNWHGRLSKEKYLQTVTGVLIVEIGLFYLYVFAMDSGNDDEFIFKIIMVWNAVIFFPFMFATMRRYHDSGKAGWKVILINVPCLVFIVLGLFYDSFAVIAFIFAGDYMVTAGADVPTSDFLYFVAFIALLLLAGAILAILNIKNILRQSDPEENIYGKPIEKTDN